MMAIDRKRFEAVEIQRELDRLARDPHHAVRRRLVAPVRLIAVLAVLAGVVTVVETVSEFGLGVAVALVWVLPMLVLGVVLGAEHLLLRLTK